MFMYHQSTLKHKGLKHIIKLIQLHRFEPSERFGQSARVTADQGYSTVAEAGKGVAFMLGTTADGKYSGLETFKPVSCGAVPALANRNNMTKKKSNTYRKFIAHLCKRVNLKYTRYINNNYIELIKFE